MRFIHKYKLISKRAITEKVKWGAIFADENRWEVTCFLFFFLIFLFIFPYQSQIPVMFLFLTRQRKRCRNPKSVVALCNSFCNSFYEGRDRVVVAGVVQGKENWTNSMRVEGDWQGVYMCHDCTKLCSGPRCISPLDWKDKSESLALGLSVWQSHHLTMLFPSSSRQRRGAWVVFATF